MPEPLKPGMPQGASAEEIARMIRLLQAGGESINRDLARAIERLDQEPGNRGAEFKRARAAQLLRQVNDHVARYTGAADQLVTPVAEGAYTLGLRQAEEQARELGFTTRRGGQAATRGAQAGSREPEAGSSVSVDFVGVDEDAVAVIARDIVARQVGALKDHAERALVVFKRVQAADIAGRFVEGERISTAIARGLITGDPRVGDRALRAVLVGRDDAELTTDEYRKAGKQQIEVGGWTGTMAQYASTVVRTRTREATVTARHERLGRAGIGLVQITGRNSANFCTRFIGLVCALTSEASEGGRYPLLSSLPEGGPPFHPNCSKGTAAYVPDLVSDERAAASANATKRYERAKESGTLEEPIRGAA